MPPRAMKVNRRHFMRSAARWTVGSAAAAGFYSWHVEPHWIDVVQRAMPVPGLPPHLEGKRVVQLSDLHVSQVVSQDYLQRAIDRAADLRPDLVLVTGDLMTARHQEQVEPTVDLLRRFNTDESAVYVIPGNHDYGASCAHPEIVDSLYDRLDRVGIRGLRSETADHEGLQILGCDELLAGRFRAPLDIDAFDPSLPTIAMTHNPDTVDLGGWEGFRGWVLAGHTHGGQCRLPYFGAPILPIRNHRYTAGEIKLSDTCRLYVNRGLGYSYRVRMNCSPEITLFHLTAT